MFMLKVSDHFYFGGRHGCKEKESKKSSEEENCEEKEEVVFLKS